MFKKGRREPREPEKQRLAAGTERGAGTLRGPSVFGAWTGCAVAADALGFQGLMQSQSNPAELMVICFRASPPGAW